VTEGVLVENADDVDADGVSNPAGQMNAGAVGQGVVITAAGDIENIAGAQGYLKQDRAAIAVMELLGQVTETLVGNGPVGAALVYAPGLLAFDVEGENFMGVEMGVEGLMFGPRTIEVALDLGAEAFFDEVESGGHARRQGVDVVGDKRGATAQP